MAGEGTPLLSDADAAYEPLSVQQRQQPQPQPEPQQQHQQESESQHSRMAGAATYDPEAGALEPIDLFPVISCFLESFGELHATSRVSLPGICSLESWTLEELRREFYRLTRHVEQVADLTLRQRLKHFNGMLVFLMFYMACCAFNYGYDVGTFAGVQAMHSFASRFGVCDADDVCALPGWLSSVMTSTPFFGKAIGCISAGYIAERWGRKRAILCLCIISFVGVTLQVSSVSSAAQFTIGRIITYMMTGMAIVVVPIYQAETSPRELRGMFGATIQLMIVFGQVVSSLVAYGTKDIPSARGWRTVVSLQYVAPAVLFALLPRIPESPRWLLGRGRRADAAAALRRLRRRDAGDTDDDIELEIEALAFAHAHEEKGSWAEVFDRENRRRTGVAVLAMFGQQITGQAFPSQYGVIFYQSQGFGDMSFLFGVISNCVSLVATIFTWFYVDGVGRRPVLMVGGFFMGAWLLVLGGVGTVSSSQITQSLKDLMVASIMLFGVFYNLSWAPCSFIVVSEVAAQRLKEKTNLLACVVSVLTTFVTSFTTPYLINSQYANLGGRVGFIYGSINLAMVVAVFLFIPELKGRTLEEVDQLFASGEPLRRFGRLRTRSATVLYRDRVGAKLDDGAAARERVETVEEVA